MVVDSSRHSRYTTSMNTREQEYARVCTQILKAVQAVNSEEDSVLVYTLEQMEADAEETLDPALACYFIQGNIVAAGKAAN